MDTHTSNKPKKPIISKSVWKLMAAFAAGVVITGIVGVSASGTEFMGRVFRINKTPVNETMTVPGTIKSNTSPQIESATEGLTTVDPEVLKGFCNVDNCDLNKKLDYIISLLNGYTSSFNNFTGSFNDFTGDFNNFTEGWNNYTEDWNNFTNDWNNYTGDWNNYTEDWNNYTDDWNNYTGDWNNYTEDWNNFTDDWNNYTDDWNNYTDDWNNYTNDWNNFTNDFGGFSKQFIDLKIKLGENLGIKYSLKVPTIQELESKIIPIAPIKTISR